MKRALIVRGGWDGHEPSQVAEIFREILAANDFEVEVSESLESLADEEKLLGLDLIVPVWTMGKIEKEQVEAVSKAVASGVGIAGCHGGMCDAFRESVLWQFITGGNWVAHPGGDGVEYTVNIRNNSSDLLDGIHDFEVKSEQYYLHVDPSVEVLATTRFPTVKWFHSANGYVDMPVIWTKRWGHGRVYYNSLGHHADIFDIPEARESMKRGLLWAAEGKQIAVDAGKSVDEFASAAKMF
ncbi:MAG TPA: ThuA domain-containing protein [Spirochaetia bacterium]|nr:ThuA domain-containing protein [Spirochaetia bacterium]